MPGHGSLKKAMSTSENHTWTPRRSLRRGASPGVGTGPPRGPARGEDCDELELREDLEVLRVIVGGRVVDGMARGQRLRMVDRAARVLACAEINH